MTVEAVAVNVVGARQEVEAAAQQAEQGAAAVHEGAQHQRSHAIRVHVPDQDPVHHHVDLIVAVVHVWLMQAILQIHENGTHLRKSKFSVHLTFYSKFLATFPFPNIVYLLL